MRVIEPDLMVMKDLNRSGGEKFHALSKASSRNRVHAAAIHRLCKVSQF
jgi:hypothetical protein